MNPIPTVQRTAKQPSSTRRTSASMRSVYRPSSSRAGGTVDLWTRVVIVEPNESWSISFHPPVLLLFLLSLTRSIQYRAQMHFNLLPHPTLPHILLLWRTRVVVLTIWPHCPIRNQIRWPFAMGTWSKQCSIQGAFKKKKWSQMPWTDMVLAWRCYIWPCLVWNWPITQCILYCVLLHARKCDFYIPLMCCKPVSCTIL